MNATLLPERMPPPPPPRRGRPPGSRNKPRTMGPDAMTTPPMPTGIRWRLELNEVVRLRCRAMEHGMPLGDYLAGVLRDSLQGPSRCPSSPARA